MTRVCIVAEAGVNHNGSLELAEQLVESAIAAGADAVKFQSFRADALVTSSAPKADYQLGTTEAAESQHAMLKRLELSMESQRKLAKLCAQKGIEFLSTPFDVDSLRLLLDEIGVRRLKLPSGEITNAPLLLAAARSGLPIILSTGMSTLAEVETALALLACGYTARTSPSMATVRDVLGDADARHLLSERVTLLHCTSEYPAPSDSINLRAIDTLRGAFGLPVGLSDHSEGTAIAVAAVARGACMLEKHFTLDRNLPGPDHKASLTPDELVELVRAVRAVEQALGDGGKYPAPAELRNRTAIRKSVVAARPIRFGEPFTEENLTTKRPGTGISPLAYWELIGKLSRRDYAPDEEIEW